MERWRRLAIPASGGAVLLCVGLLLAPLLYRAVSLQVARWHWAQRGGSAYTLVVTQMCNCYEIGVYQLTVRDGRVVAVEVLGGGGLVASAPAPARFAHLTVEAGLERAARNLRDHWWPSPNRRDLIRYDRILGYVTYYESGDPDLPNFYVIYSARDLKILPP